MCQCAAPYIGGAPARKPGTGSKTHLRERFKMSVTFRVYNYAAIATLPAAPGRVQEGPRNISAVTCKANGWKTAGPSGQPAASKVDCGTPSQFCSHKSGWSE